MELRLTCVLFFVVMTITGCGSNETEPRIIYVTATPVVAQNPITNPTATAIVPSPTNSELAEINYANPTPDLLRFDAEQPVVDQHIVQAGDTLIGIAARYGISVESILAVNDLADPNTLFVGQAIRLPETPTTFTPAIKLLSDQLFVRGPGSISFDIEQFVSRQPGYIRTARAELMTRDANGNENRQMLPASQIVSVVSRDYSIDERLLLILLEAKAGWLSEPQLSGDAINYPLISSGDSLGVDRQGLYRQLSWAANVLNRGYYGWKARGWTTLEVASGERYLLDPGLNAATVALQYFFSLHSDDAEWENAISVDGFYTLYSRYFGNPLNTTVDPLVPPSLSQPAWTLPFSQDETWFFTGGAHGGWGSGSAWAAVDFAPPDEPPLGIACYTSEYWTTAIASGVIVRSERGSVVLDVDGDGDESTGWTILYLHIAEDGRIQAGNRVETGTRIGRPSCEGGFSTATHMHIARRYNGEWIPAYCHDCPNFAPRPVFNLGGWSVIGLLNQEYQGYLENNGERRIAEQGRLTPDNRVSW